MKIPAIIILCWMTSACGPEKDISSVQRLTDFSNKVRLSVIRESHYGVNNSVTLGFENPEIQCASGTSDIYQNSILVKRKWFVWDMGIVRIFDAENENYVEAMRVCSDRWTRLDEKLGRTPQGAE